MHDKELRRSRVLDLRSCHGDYALGVVNIVCGKAVGAEFALDRLGRLLIKALVHAAALDHKSANDAVEDQTGIKAPAHQANKIGNRFGCFIGIQLQLDIPVLLNMQYYLGIVHDKLLPFIIYDSDNNLIGERVFIAALIMGALGFVCFQFMIRNTEIRVEQDLVLNEEKPKFNVFKAFLNFMKNRAAVGATIAAMGMFIGMQGAATAVTVIFQSYFRNVQISGIVQLFAMIPIVVFTPLARKMVEKYGKKELATIGSLCSVVAACALFIVTPNNTGLDLVLYIISQLIFSLGLGIYSTVSWAMMGDAIDYNEWKTGTREEGTVYSLHSFFRKLAQGVGPALVLVIMVALGYKGENEGNQLWEVAVRMRYLVAATYLFSAILQFVGLGVVYNIDKKKLAEMNEALGRGVESNDTLNDEPFENNHSQEASAEASEAVSEDASEENQ